MQVAIKKEKLWSRDFITISISYFFIACAFFLLMPTIPLYLSEKLAIEPSKIGVALSSYAIALLIIRPFSGYLVDRYDRKPLLLIGFIFFVAIFVGYYFAFTVLFFIVLRFVHGLFWGMVAVSTNTAVIDIIPSKRRSEGIGIFGVNSNLAMAIAPFFGVNIYNSFGFDMLVTSAMIMGALAILVAFFIRVPKRPKVKDKAPISLDRFILVKGIPIMLNQLLISFGWGTLVGYAVLYGQQIGITNAGMFFLFIAAGIILSRVTSGKYVDKGYLHPIMMVALLVISIGFYSFSEFHNVYAYCISAFLIGIGYGTLFPALQTIYINMAPASQRGTATSTYLTGFDIGIGLGMLLGAHLGGELGFSRMYFLTGFGTLIALVIYWFNSRKVYEKHKLIEGN